MRKLSNREIATIVARHAVPVLGMASRDASVDVTPALALGVTDLLTYPCTSEDLVDRVASSMRGRRSGRRGGWRRRGRRRGRGAR